MCGIAGLIGKVSPTAAERSVSAMVDSMRLRGPDDQGLKAWHLGPFNACFGHSRLAILDLSPAGRQPLSDASGRYWVTFNGEIYNFRELRKLTESSESIYRSQTDTEVIVNGFARWQNSLFGRLRGMFAFGLLDLSRRCVHLVRDPLGIKPLYYCSGNHYFVFASEVRALLSSGLMERRLNRTALSSYLVYGAVDSSNTMVNDVKALGPGQVLTIHCDADELRWTVGEYTTELLQLQQPTVVTERSEAEAHILHLLQEAVKAHLISDVPTGLFLSGGIDSTVLLRLVRRTGLVGVRSFTIVFPELDRDEGPAARASAESCDAVHTEVSVGELEVLKDLPSALAAMDQPTMDGINSFVVSKAARQAGLKVALSGLGADELFCGYATFHRTKWMSLVARASVPVRGIGGCVRRVIADESKVLELILSDGTPASVYHISRRLLSRSQIEAVIGEYEECAPSGGHWTDPINEMSRLEMRGYMANTLLRDTDFMSMANSLEVRVPFLDSVLVRHVLRLPGDWKVPFIGPGKGLLYSAMRGLIPIEVWKRPKIGFAFPFDRWMRSALRDEIEGRFRDLETLQVLGLNPQGVWGIWQQFLNGRCTWSRPWSLFVLISWCERFGVIA